VRNPWRAIALLGVVLTVAGCQENLAGGAACPSLCPDTLVIKDTILVASEAIDTDATVVGIPPLGAEPQILLGNFTQGEQQVHTVGVFRFDLFPRSLADTDSTKPPHPFIGADSASLVLNVVGTPDSIYTPGDSITFLVYDVDTNAVDLDTAAVHARFASAPIASRTIARDSVTGSISIPIDSGFIASHIRDAKRIRLGVDVASSGNVRVEIQTADPSVLSTPNPASLHYTGIADNDRVAVSPVVNSHSADSPAIPGLADYQLVLQGNPAPPPGILAAGGFPSSRIFIRFNLPPALVDSTTRIVRANLQIHQAPNPAFASSDTISLTTLVVRAAPEVRDIAAASLLAVDPQTVAVGDLIPLIKLPPSSAQPDTIPLVPLFNLWKSEGIGKTQRAILLKSSGEGFDPRQYYFYSTAADDSLRPRIRISYIPKSGFGLP
jgi:hypothetical protein